jgi:hypothetical protein
MVVFTAVCLWVVSANVLGLCEEAELEAQMFSLAQMLIRIPNVQFSTETAFSQNPCYLPYFVYEPMKLFMAFCLSSSNFVSASSNFNIDKFLFAICESSIVF